MRLVPGEAFGRYRIEAELGRGGQAVVYRATQIDLDRQVALKVFDEGYLARPGALERFRREAIAAGRITHPHIVTVHDAGEVDGVAFISMRLVRGDTLAARIRRTGPLPPAEALAVLSDIAGALDSAHAAGTVHRDVTPGNILLEPGDGAYLSDFGLVRMDDMPGVTRRGDWLGTAEYVSPEQVEGEPAQPASDRYALAAVAFETLTGRPPHVHREPSAVLLAHVRDPIPSASAINPALPAAVDDALARGLARRPEDRPASAGELVAGLRAALAGVIAEESRPADDAAAAAVARATAAVAATGDPWQAALARFAPDPDAGPSPTATGGGPPEPVEERKTEAFGGRAPARGITFSRDMLVAAAVAGALLLGAALAGGWLIGSSTADTAGAEARAYAEGEAAGRDAGFAEGRAQGVKQGRAAGRKAGLAEGRRQGRAAGEEAGREEGYAEGRDAGYAEGREAGYASGLSDGRANAIGDLSPGGWYVVWVGSDEIGAQIGSATAISPDSGVCYTVGGGTVLSGSCGGVGD